MNFRGQHWADLDTVIIVAGHAVYKGEDFQTPDDDDNWYLQPFQAGEPPFYIEHIKYGVDLAASNCRSLLLFSGGQTRDAGPRSEAQGYWLLANHYKWWGRPGVAVRSSTEEFARDSFENLLFSICRFHECTGKYPRSVEIVSWDFKEQRFDLHRETIEWPKDNGSYKYHGVNVPKDMEAATKGERVAIADFERDPFGIGRKLKGKRVDRNPFVRQHGYYTSCPELTELLKRSDERVFSGDPPWC